MTSFLSLFNWDYLRYRWSIFSQILICCSWDNRPYAYDVTEGRPRGVGGQTRHATCTIAKHALRGQTPACLTAELARVRTLTERVSANALCQQNMCAQRDKFWPPAWRRCYGDVTSMHKVYSLQEIIFHFDDVIIVKFSIKGDSA